MANPAQIESGFEAVQYFTPSDIYYYTVDNRPLQNLAYNDQVLAAGVDNNTAAIASIISSTGGSYAVDTGAVNAYDIPLSPALTSVADGDRISFRPLHTNTGASTAAVNALTVVPILLQDGTQLVGGEIIADGVSALEYSSFYTAWILLNSAIPRARLAGSSTQVFSAANATASTQVPNAGQIQGGELNFATDTGAANAISVTLTPTLTARTEGQRLWFKAAATNTAATTINDGLGIVNLVGRNGALQGGEIVANGKYECVWQATTGNYVLVSQGGGAVQVVPGVKSSQSTTVAQVQQNVLQFALDSGSVNAIVLGFVPPLSARVDGQVIYFKAAQTNTGVTTLNDGLGVATLSTPNGALQGGEIVAGGYYEAIWEAANSAYVLIGQSTGNENVRGTLTVSGTVTTAAATATGQAVNLGQVAQVAPVYNRTTLTALGSGGTWTVSATITAPGAGYVLGTGIVNVGAQAAANITGSLIINGTTLSTDISLISQAYQDGVAATPGESVTVTMQITSGSTAPNVTCSIAAGAVFIPNP